MKVSLQDVLLALLSTGPNTGVGIERLLKGRYRHVWHTGLQQVYGDLARLRAKGLVVSGHGPAGSGPPTKVYELTSRGRAAVQSWWTGTMTAPKVRDDLFLKLASIPDPEVGLVVRHAADRLKQRKETAATLRAQIHEAERDTIGYCLSLEGSLALVEAEIRWCKELLRRVGVERSRRKGLHGNRSH